MTFSTPPAPAVTVVVTTKDSARTLEACLASVRAQSLSAELVVVDNGSTDGTLGIADRHADKVVTAGPERSAQRNHGRRLGGGDIVAFIDSDMVLTGDVLREAAELFEREPGLGGLVIPETSFGQGFWSRCRVLEKNAYLGQPDVEAARIFRRTVLEQVNGYDENLTAFEDWDLADRVVAAGHHIGRTTAAVYHDEGRITLWSAFRKRVYYGRWLRAYLSLPHARSFGRPRSVRTLLRYGAPHLVAGVIVLKAVEAAGLLLGSLRPAGPYEPEGPR